MNKIINPILAMALATIFSLSAKAQNLVPNGSFEKYYSCPDDLNQVDTCMGWYDVLNSPDYFNTCASFTVSIPSNFFGYQIPFDGNAYAGLYTYVAPEPNYREIIGTQLIGALIPENTYHVSIRVSRAENYLAASNKIGMRFTTNAYSIASPPPINNYSQIYTDSIVTDTVNWVLLAWDYIADSAYGYVYIGNFFTDINTDTVSFGPTRASDSYYFIDSVNISCGNSNRDICYTAIHPINNNDPKLVYDIEVHSIYLQSSAIEKGTLIIINSSGQRIKELTFSNNERLKLSDLANGFYIALFQSSKISLTKKIILY